MHYPRYVSLILASYLLTLSGGNAQSLDSSGNVSLPISGTSTISGSTLPIANLFGDTTNLSFISGGTVKGTQTSATTVYNKTISSGNSIFILGPNEDAVTDSSNNVTPIPNTEKHSGNYFISTHILRTGWMDALDTTDQGDILVQPWNGTLRFDRKYNDMTSTQPFTSFQMINSSPNIEKWTFGDIGGMYAKTPMVNYTSIKTGTAVGSATGITAGIYDYSTNSACEYQCQDQAVDLTVVKGGPSSTWGMSIAMSDVTGAAPGSFAQTGIEDDMGANGPDAGNPTYIPSDGMRKNLWLGIGASDSASHYDASLRTQSSGSRKSWAASTAFNTGDLIKAKSTDNKYYIYKVTTAGTTASSSPTFPTSGTVTDGSVVWTYSYPYAYGVSKGIFLDGNNFRGTAFQYYYTGVTSNALFANAFIDTTQIKLIDPSTSFTVDSNGNPQYTTSGSAAAIRIGDGQLIDLSGVASTTGHNNHTVGHQYITLSAFGNSGFESGKYGWTGFFEPNGVLSFGIDDLGDINAPGALSVASRDSANNASEFSGNRTFPSEGVTILRNASGVDETDFDTVHSGYSFRIANGSHLDSGGNGQTGYTDSLLDVLTTGITATVPVILPAERSTSLSKTLDSIKKESHSESDRIWCHDCLASGQATGKGTGRWIYKDSAGTWRADDGTSAEN